MTSPVVPLKKKKVEFRKYLNFASFDDDDNSSSDEESVSIEEILARYKEHKKIMKQQQQQQAVRSSEEEQQQQPSNRIEQTCTSDDEEQTQPEEIIQKKTKKQKQTKKRWVWDDEKVDHLINFLSEYKNNMLYKGVDFQSDLVECYSVLRKKLAELYVPTDFGPVNIDNECTDDMSKDELLKYKTKIDKQEKQKKEGYNRVKSKVKELRTGYKTAIDKGTRSGSGRLVAEHFDKLKAIWDGSPAVNAIENPISSIDEVINDEIRDEIEDGRESDENVRCTKRDNMKKKISAHQREMLHVDILNKELELKKEAIQVMRENCQSTNETLRMMSNSLSDIGQGIKDGLALLANAMIQTQSNNSTPVYMMPPHMQPQHSYLTPRTLPETPR